MTTEEALAIAAAVIRDKMEPDRVSIKFAQIHPELADRETRRILHRLETLTAALEVIQELRTRDRSAGKDLINAG